MENPAPAVFLCGAPEDYANYRAALTAAGLRPVVSRSLAAALGCEALLLPAAGGVLPPPCVLGRPSPHLRHLPRHAGP